MGLTRRSSKRPLAQCLDTDDSNTSQIFRYYTAATYAMQAAGTLTIWLPHAQPAITYISGRFRRLPCSDLCLGCRGLPEVRSLWLLIICSRAAASARHSDTTLVDESGH